MGGLSKIMLSLFAFIGNTFSLNKLYTLQIKNLFFSAKSGSFNFSAKDAFVGKNKKRFIKGRDFIKDQLDVCKLLKQLSKMRALLHALIKIGDRDILEIANQYYLEAFDIDDEQSNTVSNDFDEFMEYDPILEI